MNVKNIIKNYNLIKDHVVKTPLEYNYRLSKKYNTNIYLKREDLQITRSFKIRGATNKIINNINDAQHYGIVCASAGNHAQGFAYCCNKFNIKGDVFIPNNTPEQKKNRIIHFGENNIKVHQFGNNFNESLNESIKFADKHNKVFIHPFNDPIIIGGQATIAHEIYNDINPDYIISSVGGGGLISGIISYSKEINQKCKIIGMEPIGANSLEIAIKNSKPIELKNIDTFVDGAAVAKIGNETFNIIKGNIDDNFTSTNEEIANTIVEFYENEGIILEPAAALSITGLSKIKNFKQTDTVVCVVSGGNNDITRYQEIMDLNLRYLNRKHYFIIKFAQKSGQLKNFINDILSEHDDITRFEYIKKTNKNFGDVLICIETNHINKLINRFNKSKFNYKKITPNDLIYNYLI